MPESTRSKPYRRLIDRRSRFHRRSLQHRPRQLRLLRLHALRMRVRVSNAILRSAVRMDVWIYLAAAALVGFEGLEVLFGALLLAPELVPFVLLTLALIWTMKKHGRWIRRRIALARRRRRLAGHHAACHKETRTRG